MSLRDVLTPDLTPLDVFALAVFALVAICALTALATWALRGKA